MACLLAGSPTNLCPSFVNATYEGNALPPKVFPSALGIIVGFPAETDADFEQTVKLAKEVGFAKMHVFAFSPRKGTAAADMHNTLNPKVVKERSKILRDLDKKLQRDFRQQFIGETAEVLLENSSSRPRGRAERYFYVYLNKLADGLKANDLVKVKLLKNGEDGVLGEIFY